MFTIRNWHTAALSLFVCVAATHAAGGELDRFKNLEGVLNIAGGTAHIPVMNEAAKNIMKAQPKIRITVAGGGSGVGVKKVGAGLVDIGNTGRPVSEAENKKFGLTSFPFAIDGVATVVHPENPVSKLKAAQVRDIYAGKITNWKDVGGKDGEIHLFTRDEASGTRSVFWKKLLKKGPIEKKANVVASNGAMKVAVAKDPNAIGYVSLGHVDKKIQAPALDGVAVSQETAASGKYPVVRKLFMNTKGKPGKLAQAFIDYILSDEGAAIIRASGYLPVKGGTK